jgi:hypothetical protein
VNIVFLVYTIAESTEKMFSKFPTIISASCLPVSQPHFDCATCSSTNV